jgi:uncharacterized membrane protein
MDIYLPEIGNGILMMQWFSNNIDICLSFIMYSFLGWVIESAYKTFREHKGFINSGFLNNPLIPIYGIGAVIIILIDAKVGNMPFPIKVILFTIVCTTLEYITGFLIEKIFRIKLWNYANRTLNLHGRICLLNTFYWSLLITVFLLYIRPMVEAHLLTSLSFIQKFYITVILYGVIVTDFIISTLELKSTTRIINNIVTNMKTFNEILVASFSKKMKTRFLKVFPNLGTIYNEQLKNNLLYTLEKKIEQNNIRKAIGIIITPPEVPEEMDQQYVSIVKDLIDDENVLKMSNFPHHDSSTLKHCLTVSQVSYYLAKEFNLDVQSTSRGSLLHDFYLYNWQDGVKRNHAMKHSKIALENAKKLFKLNGIEEDIIVKHMWPLTNRFFRYKEAFLVSMVDKLVSVVEVKNALKKIVNKKINKV